MDDWMNWVQWPAFMASVIAAWLVASKQKPRRNAGFWVFLLSNALWLVWGFHTWAWGLIALQFSLGALNIRGLFKTEYRAGADTSVGRLMSSQGNQWRRTARR